MAPEERLDAAGSKVMNVKLLAWINDAYLRAGQAATLSEHLDYFGFAPADYQNGETLRSIFDDVVQKVDQLSLPVKVLLVCPLKDSASAFSRAVPGLDEVWSHLRVVEPPSIHLVPFSWCLTKEEVVECRVYYAVPKSTEGIYLRTFRRVDEPDEPESYDSALYFETFEPVPDPARANPRTT